MSKENLCREYRLKSYLNMNHYITINGRQGQTHPHTWEFVTIEKYQNQILNMMEPFDIIVPTIENVTDHFSEELQRLLRKHRGELVSLEGSETPTRSYIVSHRNEQEFIEMIK